jgi:hypothetical protein
MWIGYAAFVECHYGFSDLETPQTLSECFWRFIVTCVMRVLGVVEPWPRNLMHDSFELLASARKMCAYMAQINQFSKKWSINASTVVMSRPADDFEFDPAGSILKFRAFGNAHLSQRNRYRIMLSEHQGIVRGMIIARM